MHLVPTNVSGFGLVISSVDAILDLCSCGVVAVIWFRMQSRNCVVVEFFERPRNCVVVEFVDAISDICSWSSLMRSRNLVVQGDSVVEFVAAMFQNAL